MVTHEIAVNGANLQGSVPGASPMLLQMNQEDFPARFLSDLAAAPTPLAQLSTAKPVPGGAIGQPAVLFQPVQRIVHLAMLQLACNVPGQPRLDPLRLAKAGIVIRRLRRSASSSAANPSFDPSPPYQAWMKSATGQYQWRVPPDPDADPDPQQRPQIRSGQPYLDAQLATTSLASAWSEVFTPAFLAPPQTIAALNRTIVYGLVPTASSEVSDAALPVAVYQPDALAASLPTLLKNNSSAPSAPASGTTVDYRWLSDAYASASPRNAPDFAIFATALLMLYRQFNAFDGSQAGNAILSFLADKHVTLTTTDSSGATVYQTLTMADFFTLAKQVLIDYDPASGSAIPSLLMPTSWEPFSTQDQAALIALMVSSLQANAAQVQFPEGRYQDPARLYQLRVFFRIKGHTPDCPAQLYWSDYSPVFRIAAWYDSSQRAAAPIPLPDPTLRSFLAAKPNISFSVPKGLMNAMQGASMSNLTDGSATSGSLNLNWICGFNIPIITICAFFVLNIFLVLLNIVLFWLPFIKICIPFPVSMPASGDD
jgi:hypothetical protein